MAGSFLSWVFPTGPRVCVGSRIILKVALIIATWAVGSVCHVASWGRDLNSGCCELSEDVASLVEKLSPTAHIYFPGSNDFSRATKRWSALKTPGVRFVVVPTTENDVAETVSRHVLPEPSSASNTNVTTGQIRKPTRRSFPRSQCRARRHYNARKYAKWHSDLA